MQVLAYCRVSTEEQGNSGAGLSAQREAIRTECERRGWDLDDVVEDRGYSAKNLKRPGVQAALATLERGEADGLVVAKLDRLSRSVIDFAGLMELAQKQGWALVALDLGVDSTTPSGEAMAGVLSVFAQFERRLIGERTKAALAIRKAEGVRLGRPPQLPAAVRRKIRRKRDAGLSFAAIAEALNEAGVPTAHDGRRWYSSTVSAAVRTEGA